MIYHIKMNSNFKSIKYKWIYNSVDKNLIEETAYKHNMPKPVAELMLKKEYHLQMILKTFLTAL